MLSLQASYDPLASPSQLCRRKINRVAVEATPLLGAGLSSTGSAKELVNASECEVAMNTCDPLVLAKLYTVVDALGDRVRMHKNIGEQRDNWNSLFLISVNMMMLTAAIVVGMATVSSVSNDRARHLALKATSTVLYLAAAVMLVMVNVIQPSQLAEEQRNAARLFKQLRDQVRTRLSIGNPSIMDVDEAMEKILALDKAYPLPLIGKMLEKFPKKIEPAVWWPQISRQRAGGIRLGGKKTGNGWSEKLEDGMRDIVGVLRRKDSEDYSRLSKKALKMNKVLAISGPVLTILAAFGSLMVGFPHRSWASVMGMVCGALACIVNTIGHGGQVGMVFEMYRNNAGFFKLVEENIESNLSERDAERREDGDILRLKVALQLGRNFSELEKLGKSLSSDGEAIEEFASKLF
ncbi:probable F-box protein At4g22030 [Rhodamnia argentea]|uniref:Probable F-box protein At4g22030 n=1 Tax=Rhodamnia argentea TaxID=178133 RepID=A0A8B8PF64_9MYRT|nr:probable F-box protein At4g22030 [Rhodamnia argentea]